MPFSQRPKIVDVTDRARVVAAKIVETAIECTDEEKEVLLYYLVRVALSTLRNSPPCARASLLLRRVRLVQAPVVDSRID